MKAIPQHANAAGLPTMSSVVYANVRQDILQGALRPSDKLRIDQLCERYKVTSTPVREALNQLAVEGFVLRQEQRGFFVAEATMVELEQLTKTRCWIEPIALREAILHRTEAWEEKLVLASHRLSRINRSASETEFIENAEWEKAHRIFHMALIATCSSRWLLDFCGLLFDHATRYRNLAMSVIYPQRDVTGEHRDLFDAAINGQIDEAAGKLVEHYRRTALILEQGPAKKTS
jgi:DNA-binding GntR family transcriptional regulator